MKKIIAIALISMALLQVNAQTNKGTTATQKIETNGKKPTTTTSTTTTTKPGTNNGTTTTAPETIPTNNGKPGTTGKDKENEEHQDEDHTKDGSSNANEKSKEKSNNGNHYGQIKNADKAKGKPKKGK